MTSPLTLTGMTWSHSRGHLPLLATAQRFSEINPNITIRWEARSLRDFEDFPIEQLAAAYDFVVLDHPCIGRVAASGHFLPLEESLPATFMAAQATGSVGGSHASYHYANHHWALAIDAAAPVALWREDLMAMHDARPPQDWAELLALGRRGLVETPAAPINCLMNFFALSLAAGAELMANPREAVAVEPARQALDLLRQLLAVSADGCWERNPIHSHDLLSAAANRQLCYCPFAYGYSNYARAGYADHVLRFGEVPTVNGLPLRTVLGGAGLAVTANRPHRAEALRYAAYVASPSIQRTQYTQNGGQPGHRSAWEDSLNNALCGNFFAATLPVLDRAWVRPRFDGFISFQSTAAELVHRALLRQLTDRDAIAQLNSIYQSTLSPVL